MPNNVIKIVVETPDIDLFRKLVRDLPSNDITFHTYQLKSERAFKFKVVIRNLHYSMDVDKIKNTFRKAEHGTLSYSTLEDEGALFPFFLSILSRVKIIEVFMK